MLAFSAAAHAQPAGYVSLDAFESASAGAPSAPSVNAAPAHAPFTPVNSGPFPAAEGPATVANTPMSQAHLVPNQHAGTHQLPSLGNGSLANVPTVPVHQPQGFVAPAPGVPQHLTGGPGTTLFDAVRGASLRATLEQWARQAGWQPLAWKLPDDTDFTLGASARFEGDFVTATRNFVAALGAEANLRVRFNQGNRLAVVEPMQ